MLLNLTFRILKFYILAHALFSVGGCDGGGGCIDPDDFGNKKFSVSAYVAKGSKKFSGEDDLSITTDHNNANQVIRWSKTPFITNGKNIVIRVKGMWTAWGGNEGKVFYDGKYEDASKVYDENADYDKFIPKASEVCDQYESITKEVNNGTAQCKKIQYSNTPCWFKNGHGLYILLQRPEDSNPNGNIDVIRVPISPTKHVGYADNENGIGQFFWNIGDAVDPATGKQITIEQGWGVYLKILDRYYWDNAGEYKVTFVSGIYDPTESAGVFEYVRELVTDKLLSAAKTIFTNVTANTEYVNMVKTILILFVVFTGIAYLIGMVQQKQSDVIVRIIKVGIVLQLIQPNSWEFFYDHFFVLFINGTNQLIAIINSHNIGYDLEKPFKFLDDFLVQRLFSSQTWAKISSIFLTNILGFLWFIILFLTILYFIYCCAIVFIAYLVALVAVSIIIIIFPISLLAILFASPLRNIFDAWVTQIASFAFQAVLSFSLLSFFFGVIMNFIYRNLGFITCDRGWFQLRLCLFFTDLCVNLYTFEAWVPGRTYKKVIFGFFDSATFTNFVPAAGSLGFSEKRYAISDTKATIPVPPEYKVHEERYVDIPYLHPVADKDRIDAILSNSVHFFGDVFYAPELFNLLLFTFIISAMRSSVQSVGRFISGGSLFAPVIGAGMPLVHQFTGFLKGLTVGRYQDWVGAKTDKMIDLKDKVSRTLWGAATLGMAGDMMHRATGASDSVSNRVKDALEKDEKFKFLYAAQDAMGGSLEYAKSRAEALTDLASLKAISSAGVMDADELHGDKKWNYRRHMEAVMFPYMKRKDDSDSDTSRGDDGSPPGDGPDDKGDDSPPGDGPGGDQPIVSRSGDAAAVQPSVPPTEDELSSAPDILDDEDSGVVSSTEGSTDVDETSQYEERLSQSPENTQDMLRELDDSDNSAYNPPQSDSGDSGDSGDFGDSGDSGDGFDGPGVPEDYDLPDGSIGDDSNIPPDTHATESDTHTMAEVEPTEVEPTEVEPAEVEPTEVEPAEVESAEVEPTEVEPQGTDFVDDADSSSAAAFVDTEVAESPPTPTAGKVATKVVKKKDTVSPAAPDRKSASKQEVDAEPDRQTKKKTKLSKKEREHDDSEARLIDLRSRKEELERQRKEFAGNAPVIIKINEELIRVHREIAGLTDE
jgi:type IV secretory pathway VirB6-like protein